jgi:uncharacterized protein YecT (DUF1311 family)
MKFRSSFLHFGVVSMIAAPAVLTAAPVAQSYDKFELTKSEVKAVAQVTTTNCSKKAGGPKFQIKCRTKLAVQSDARLNASYKRTMARLNTSTREKLRNEERDWIVTRYKECEELLEGVQYPAEGRAGIEYKIEAKDCVLIEIKRRTLWIDRYK